jgi:NlpC/P60 family
MKAVRLQLAAALALALLGCATRQVRMGRASLPPPARESRAGAPTRSAGPDSGSSAAPPTRVGEDARRRAVEAASALVGRRSIVVDGVDYGGDCVALVRAAFERAGRPLPKHVRDATDLYGLAARGGVLEATRRPSAGDVVFMANRPGGPAAHVGLVARLEPDGTALVLHRVARGVLRVRMNLAWPARRTDPATGRHVNDMLLVGTHPVPAGSLVVGVADLLRVRG